MRNVFSIIIIIATIIGAAVAYYFIFTGYDKIWFNFMAIFLLCLTTFLLAVGIFIGAILVERRR